MNISTLTGRLGQDPESKFVETRTGQKLKVKFNICVSEWYAGEERTTWVPIELWGKVAEFAVKHLQKGTMVSVVGKIAVDKWDTQDGEPRKSFYVLAQRLEKLSFKKDADVAEADAAEDTEDTEDDEF